ncbi:MAG: GTPase Era [Acidobacteria bacterium]|nr:GTPase Era [Acidobacteriota bacterium]
MKGSTPGEPAPKCGVVAVVGRPNVGKSTLVNRLVGQKVCIVSPMPQTTRNRISGVCSRPGAQVILLDTPGIHRPQHRMNTSMVQTAVASLSEIDLIYFVVEVPALGPGDRHVLSLLRPDGPPVFLVVNKIDRAAKPSLLPMLDAAAKAFPFAEIFPVSAKDGDNVEPLIAATVPRLPDGPPLFPDDQPTDQPERFLAAELIREQICLRTHQEVPHEAAVRIDSWTEREDGLVSIVATILVEKENQKAIVIGREGTLLKSMATAARLEIEKLLACRVFLKVWVRAEPGWRENAALLRSLGLG